MPDLVRTIVAWQRSLNTALRALAPHSSAYIIAWASTGLPLSDPRQVEVMRSFMGINQNCELARQLSQDAPEMLEALQLEAAERETAAEDDAQAAAELMALCQAAPGGYPMRMGEDGPRRRSQKRDKNMPRKPKQAIHFYMPGLSTQHGISLLTNFPVSVLVIHRVCCAH